VTNERQNALVLLCLEAIDAEVGLSMGQNHL